MRQRRVGTPTLPAIESIVGSRQLGNIPQVKKPGYGLFVIAVALKGRAQSLHGAEVFFSIDAGKCHTANLLRLVRFPFADFPDSFKDLFGSVRLLNERRVVVLQATFQGITGKAGAENSR